MLRLLPLLALLAGCKADNPLSCELDDNAGLPECQGIGPDGPTCEPACGAGQVCAMGECVCNADEGCIGNPAGGICTENACGPCTSHEQCTDSEVCLLGGPNAGACADRDAVIYVAANGTDPMCRLTSPCGDLEAARMRLMDPGDGRRIIKVSGAITNPKEVVFDVEGEVTIFAGTGASITRNGSNQILEVKAATALAIHDLTIAGAIGGNGHGIVVSDEADLRLARVTIEDNAGSGISSTSTGELVIDHGTILDNIGIGVRTTDAAGVTITGTILSGNLGGGAELAAAELVMANNIIAVNGSATSSIGGLRLDPDTGELDLVEFNTVANNTIVATSGDRGGINCVENVLGRGNIVTGNRLGPGCTMFSHSLFDVGVAPPGENNLEGDPMFKNMNPADPRNPGYFRIRPGSAANETVPTAVSPLAEDIDGEVRPQGTMLDMGADEIQPPG